MRAPQLKKALHDRTAKAVAKGLSLGFRGFRV